MSLITEEVRLPSPRSPFSPRLPGELSGSNDPQLQPREGKVIGRIEQVREVVDFLTRGEVCAQVLGGAGIGKTEICKYALAQWLKNVENPQRIFWVSVPDMADVSEFLSHLGRSVGIDDEKAEVLVENPEALGEYLPNGLFWFVTQMYARFSVEAGQPCSDRGFG